ncbi:MAG: glycosyltransferase 87 family protein [Solirubrobacteraceae bacterium]
MPTAVPTVAGARTVGVGAGRVLVRAGAVAGLAAALGACLWMVAAAAERPSVLSPPSLRSPQSWLLGPLHGALPHLTTAVPTLRADLDIALVVLFAAWLVAWACAPALPVRAVAAAVGAAQVLFVLGPPQPVTDVFNYLVYGRMAARGLNPYAHPPVAGSHDVAYALSNWHHLPSPYGPLFTLLSEPLALLPLPAAFWAWKVVVGACAIAMLGLVWWLARRLGRSPQRAIVFAGLCPVTLAVGVGGFHNDLPAVLCVLAAGACLLRAAEATEPGMRWDAAAGALVVLASGLKPPFAIVVPLVLLGAHRRLPAAAGAVVATAIVGAVTLVAFDGVWPSLGAQGALVTPLSVPNLLGLAAGHQGADPAVRAAGRDALVVIVVAATAAVAWRRRWALPAIGAVLLASVLTLSWTMPWYLAWALPFAAIGRPRMLAPFAVATCVWLGVGASPVMPKLIHALGYFPTRTTTGLANHRYEQRLVR